MKKYVVIKIKQPAEWPVALFAKKINKEACVSNFNYSAGYLSLTVLVDTLPPS